MNLEKIEPAKRLHTFIKIDKTMFATLNDTYNPCYNQICPINMICKNKEDLNCSTFKKSLEKDGTVYAKFKEKGYT